MLLKWPGSGPRMPRLARLAERFLPFAVFERFHNFNDRKMIIMSVILVHKNAS